MLTQDRKALGNFKSLLDLKESDPPVDTKKGAETPQ